MGLERGYFIAISPLIVFVSFKIFLDFDSASMSTPSLSQLADNITAEYAEALGENILLPYVITK